MIEEMYLRPTSMITSDDPAVVRLAAEIAGEAGDDRETAVRLFEYVRDEIRYDPYALFFLPEQYRAGTILARGGGYCVQKSSLLVALARARGIPSRLIFADLRNRLDFGNLRELMGTDIFTYHGYVEWRIDGTWLRVTPSFPRAFCDDHEFITVEFNGEDDAVLHDRDRLGRPHFEYVRHHGVFADVPLGRILEAWKKTYGEDVVEKWKNALNEREDQR